MIRIPFGPTLASVMVLLAGMSAGCANSYKASYPEPRTLISERPVHLPPPSGKHVPIPPDKYDRPLSLEEAVALALEYNPTLRSAAFEQQARENEASQAARLPNPELDAGIDEFGGIGSRTGLRSLEIGGSLSQTLEWGGDRRARSDVAARGAEWAAWVVESTRLDVVTEVRYSFIGVLAAKARLEIAEEQGEIARRLADAIERRAAEGAVSPLEARRARVAAITAVTVLERARRFLDNARARLAATFGGDVEYVRVKGTLPEPAPVPELERLVPLLQLNPELAQYATLLEEARAHTRLERARRIPDATVRFGAAYFNELGESAISSGITIPLPLFNTNKGAIRAADARIAATEADAESAFLRARRELTTLYGTLVVSADAARMLYQDALPNARAAYDGILTGYHEGEYGLLDVLDAQSAFLETRNAYADALSDFHQARAAVERLIATPFHAVEDAHTNQR